MPYTYLLSPLRAAAIVSLTFLPATGYADDVIDRDPAKIFQPHEAVYELKIRKWNLPLPGRDFSGIMTMSVIGDCKLLATSVEMEMRGTAGNGTPISVSSLSNYVERRDGTEIKFRHTNFANGRVTREVSGTADRVGPGKPVTVSWEKPTRRFQELTADTLFPWQAYVTSTRDMLRGKKFNSHRSFSGAYDVPIRMFHTVIRSGSNGVASSTKGSGTLSEKSWRISSSAFDDRKEDSPAIMSFVTESHDNGVLSYMKMDLGFAIVDFNLRGVKNYPKPSC